MSILDDPRAAAVRFPAAEIRTGDFLTLAGSCLPVTAAAHRGGTTWLELDRCVRVQLHSLTEVTVIRPVRPARRARPVRPVRAAWPR
ncbi:hypothetical protein [Streptomyces lonarensis]|uniref:Uncharacterized protein n=1 Tax=Streptomyces lonarensis TaxID=700599 RepID=A0A7X6D4F7_9ACTN|nr:hypothetical protein [Streptomyces lonarensis]NJQ04402.1 hypothetical protein [Streptomyces lonarensis]NJQ08016.1 hypothetical protein [Streptomyces lonarensis]